MWNDDIARSTGRSGFHELLNGLPAGRRITLALALGGFALLAVLYAGLASGPAAAHEGGHFKVTGKLIKPEAVAYGYGTHALVGEESGTIYALRSELVNLDRHVGAQVTVSGTKVPEYEGGAVEDGPSLIEVSGVEIGTQGPGDDQYADEPDTGAGPPENTGNSGGDRAPENTGNSGGDTELPDRLPDTGGIGLGTVLLAAGLLGGSLLLRRL